MLEAILAALALIGGGISFWSSVRAKNISLDVARVGAKFAAACAEEHVRATEQVDRAHTAASAAEDACNEASQHCVMAERFWLSSEDSHTAAAKFAKAAETHAVTAQAAATTAASVAPSDHKICSACKAAVARYVVDTEGNVICLNCK